MNRRRWPVAPVALVVAASLLGGCASYDYFQRTDRISYHAGDAVRANLERQTINPSSASMYDTGGLGKNGSVIAAETQDAGAAAEPPAAPTGGAQPPALQ